METIPMSDDRLLSGNCYAVRWILLYSQIHVGITFRNFKGGFNNFQEKES